MSWARLSCILATLLLSAGSLYAETTAALTTEIHRDGAQRVVRRLNQGSRTAWNVMLAHVATGDVAWLEIAIALRPGADAGNGEDLQAACARALAKNPVAVLRIAAPAFGLPQLCGIPLIEPNEAQVSRYKARGNAALDRITDPALLGTVQRCRGYLNRD